MPPELFEPHCGPDRVAMSGSRIHRGRPATSQFSKALGRFTASPSIGESVGVTRLRKRTAKNRTVELSARIVADGNVCIISNDTTESGRGDGERNRWDGECCVSKCTCARYVSIYAVHREILFLSDLFQRRYLFYTCRTGGFWIFRRTRPEGGRVALDRSSMRIAARFR